MKIAIVGSNCVPISPGTKKGTEIFLRILINALHKLSEKNNLRITAFAAKDSVLPVPIVDIQKQSSMKHSDVLKQNKHIIFELALISKAIDMSDEFDLLHINIGDGDIALPFAGFTRKPLLITVHHTLEAEYIEDYFSLFADLRNVFFVAPSNYQKNLLPRMNSVETIYHGIDLEEGFDFDLQGGDALIWAGRAIPVKGPDAAIQTALRLDKPLSLFALSKNEHAEWFQKAVTDVAGRSRDTITLYMDTDRRELMRFMQKSKAFLFPISYEEAFGLVLIEAMACGTPVIAYAKGAVPEIIKDGETGFIVNPSDEDMRGEWTIKKTGIDGLSEAVERIYALSAQEYEAMRRNCREHVKENFTSERMAHDYIKAYNRIIRAGI